MNDERNGTKALCELTISKATRGQALGHQTCKMAHGVWVKTASPNMPGKNGHPGRFCMYRFRTNTGFSLKWTHPETRFSACNVTQPDCTLRV